MTLKAIHAGRIMELAEKTWITMKDPTTAIDASQMELMDQIKKAYGCIPGTGPDMSGT